MAIGEFGGAPAAPGGHGPMYAAPAYWLYELSHAALNPSRAFERPPRRPQPRILIVAPMSGHYPTLLRGTVQAFLPNHDVYVTEWVDARMVPVSDGAFDLDDYIDYVISILHMLGG